MDRAGDSGVCGGAVCICSRTAPFPPIGTIQVYDRIGPQVSPVRPKLCLVAAAIALLGVVHAGTSAAAPAPKRVETCGLLPGEGAYNYVKLWNVGCAKAKKLAKKAFHRFCDPIEHCSTGAPEKPR